MRNELQKEHSSSLALYHGKPESIFKELCKEFEVQEVYTNHDYEPYAKNRDAGVAEFLKYKDIDFKTFKDQVIFEKDEVVKDDGDPYVVYTPYKNKWKERFNADAHLTIHYTSQYLDNLIEHSRLPNISLSDMGFEISSIKVPEYTVTPTLIENYEKTRNFPAKENGTSPIRLRFKIRYRIRSKNDEKSHRGEKRGVLERAYIGGSFLCRFSGIFPHSR